MEYTKTRCLNSNFNTNISLILKCFWMFSQKRKTQNISLRVARTCVLLHYFYLTKTPFHLLPHFTKCWITLWNWEWWFATCTAILVPKHCTLLETNTGWVVLIYLQMDTIMWIYVLITAVWFCTREVFVARSNALILLSIPALFIESFFHLVKNCILLRET